MAEFDTQINVGMNVDGVVAGTEKAKRSVRDLGDGARNASKSLEGMGDGTAQSAQKVESATRSMIQSIQRTTAATEAGDKSTRAYQESLARLRGVDVAALRPYLDQLDQAKTKAEAAARSADSLGNSLSNIRAGAAIVAAAGAAFVAYAKNINNGVDALNDLRDATGASIENISALEDIARRTGTSFDTVGTSLLKLNQSLGASKPGSDTEKAIKAIGLSVSDLKSLDPAEAFRKIAVSLSGYSDDANKARLTQELFGKSLKEIAPLLKDVAEGGKLVGTVTTAQAEAAEKLNKQIFNLQKNATDLSRTFVASLVPAISEGADRFLTAYKHAGSLLGVLALYTRLDYSKGVQGNLAQIEEQIKGLEERATRITSDSVQKGNDKQIADLKAQAAYLKEIRQTKILIAQGDNSDAVSRKYLDRKTSVGDIGAGPTAAQISAAAAAAKAARALAIKEELEGFKTMDDARKEYDKAIADSIKERERYNESFTKSADAVAKNLQGLQDEEKALALSASGNMTLATAIAEVAVERLREAQAIELSYGNDVAAKAIQREIDLRRELAVAINSKDAREAAKKLATDSANEIAKAAEKMQDYITDGLMRGFESGKGFVQNLVDTTRNLFSSLVLRPTVSALVSAGTGALGFGGAANASALGGVTSGATTLAQYGALASTFGGSLSAGFAATVNSFGAATGVAIEGGLASIATGTSSAIAGGLGQIAGALGPYALAAVAIAGLLGAFKGEYVKGAGSATLGFDASGATTSKNQFGNAFDFQTDAADKFVASLLTEYTSAANRLGVKNAGGAFAFGSNNSDGGKFGVNVAVGSSSYASTDIKATPEALQLEASRAVFAALQGSELPGYLSKLLDGITASSATEQQINDTLTYAQGLKAVRDALTETREPLQILKDNVAESLAALGTTADTFKTDFVAAIDAGIDPSKLAQYQKLGAGLSELAAQSGAAGVAVSKTAAAIASERNSLQDQLDQLTLSNTDLLAKQRAALDGSNVALFDQVQAATAAKSAAEAAAEAARTQAEAARNAAEEYARAQQEIANAIATQRTGLQDQLDQLTLSNAELLAKQRAALDGSNRALFDQVQAATAAKKAAEDLAEAENAIATQRTGLQDQLDQLTLSPAALVAKQRAALDASNQGLFDQVQEAIGANKAKEAAEKAATQATEAATAAQEKATAAAEARAADIVNERKSLRDQLDQLTLSSTELMLKQRFALAGTNVALFDQVQAATAAKKAAEDLATAQAKVAQERTGLQDQLDQLTLSNTDLLVKQRAALDDSNRALFDQVTAAQSAANALASFKSAMESLGNTRSNLQVQLLTAQGRPAEALALRRQTELDAILAGKAGQDVALLTAAFNANSALEDQITATNEAAAAAAAFAQAQQQAADRAKAAADQIKDAWQSATNTLVDEVRRIRGLTGVNGEQTYARAQANFSIAAAQARANDQGAANALPELSKILLELAAQNTSSLAELSFIRATTAGTLEEIARKYVGEFGLSMPRLDTGTNFIPQDGPYYLHKGESVTPTRFNPAAGGVGSSSRLESLVETLIKRVEALEIPLNKIDTSTADHLTLFDSVTEGGNATRSVVMEPIPT